MKKFISILLFFASAICFSQIDGSHKHIPDSTGGKSFGSNVESIDSKREIVFSKVRYRCKICGHWYDQREHIDTISIVEKIQPPKIDMTLAQFKAYKAAQQKHVHKPAKGAKPNYDPVLYLDTTSIKHNVITFVMENYTCAVCEQSIRQRVNVDTFSTKRTAKYSNLKYPKH